MKSRSICGDPMRAFVEIHEHRRVATRGDNPVSPRSFLEFVRPEQFGSLGAFEAVFSIEDIGRPAIGIAYRAGIGESFDLIRALLAVVAITGSAGDRPAERLEFDAAAGA